jgi:hypothetical protein
MIKPKSDQRDTLLELMRYASGFCVKRFRQTGVITRIYHMVTADGEHAILPHPPTPDKDLAMQIMRDIFEVANAIRYVCLDEAWMIMEQDAAGLTDADWLQIRLHGVRSHPKRTEVVMLSGEDHAVGQLLWWHRIHRPPNKRPYLGPLEEMPPSGGAEGRMVGLLPAKGPMQ